MKLEACMKCGSDDLYERYDEHGTIRIDCVPCEAAHYSHDGGPWEVVSGRAVRAYVEAMNDDRDPFVAER